MRKNFLNQKNNSLKKAFAIPYALFISFIIALVGVYTMELSTKTQSALVKENIKTQMNLYIDSTIEYALLKLSQEKTISASTTDIIDSYEIDYPNNFKFKVSVIPLYGINSGIIASPQEAPEESAGTVIIDIKGIYQDDIYPFSISLRTIQKP